MVNLVELCLLRVLNEKNNDKALEFPVRAFSALTEFTQLSLDEITEITELDHSIMLPIVKRLVKQRILKQANGKFAINRKLQAINKMII